MHLLWDFAHDPDAHLSQGVARTNHAERRTVQTPPRTTHTRAIRPVVGKAQIRHRPQLHVPRLQWRVDGQDRSRWRGAGREVRSRITQNLQEAQRRTRPRPLDHARFNTARPNHADTRRNVNAKIARRYEQQRAGRSVASRQVESRHVTPLTRRPQTEISVGERVLFCARWRTWGPCNTAFSKHLRHPAIEPRVFFRGSLPG